MNIPKLRKQPTIKTCHSISWEDDFSWVHQENILEVLKDGSKLLPEVKNYLDEENTYTQKQLEDTKPLQKKPRHFLQLVNQAYQHILNF